MCSLAEADRDMNQLRYKLARYLRRGVPRAQEGAEARLGVRGARGSGGPLR